ncbi:3'-5' exoribonuclease 1-like [Babylonia areolata]|uniref:3'-5' exoribonuclease 1-like n=1 Tax=Babylonia areolata TaxID=304850 RepID=UPI003FCF16F4
MNSKITPRKPRSRSGSAASNSEPELTLSSTAQRQRSTDSMSEHKMSTVYPGHTPRQPNHQQITHGHCLSVAEKGAIGDGVYQAERPDPPGVDTVVTEDNSTEGAEVSSTASSGQQSDFSDPVFKKLARLNGEINRMRKDQLRKKLAELHLNTGGVKEVLKKRLKNYYRRKKLAAANIVKGTEMPYDYLVVIDYEATCQENNDHFVQEIIEFPAVLIEVQQKEIVGMFREFCKPVLNPVLTEFCKQLTGVNQSEVDSALEFPVVLEHFDQWLQNWELGTSHTFCVVTDGPWDIHRFLSKQCEISQLPFPRWSRRWINLRKSYGNFYDSGRLNLNNMLENLGLQFEGRPHCGLDDSKNIARIVCHMLEDGCVLKVNEKLDGQPSFVQSHGCVDAGNGNPSGDYKPLSKKGVSTAVAHPSKLGPATGGGKQRTVKEPSGLECEGDVSDLLYYFSLQSA